MPTSALVSDGPIFSLAREKIGEKRVLCSETAVTYLLCRQTHFYATPIAYQKKPNRKLGLRFGKEETSLENKKPKRKLGLRFGKEETSLENKKHRLR